MGTGLHLAVKRPRRGFKHPSPTDIEVKETIELHFDSLLAFGECSRVKFNFFTVPLFPKTLITTIALILIIIIIIIIINAKFAFKEAN